MELDSRFFNHDAQAGGFYPLAHVGINIADFAKGQNVLIEGIRGTGKTHVLKMLHKYYVDNFSEFRVLPVFVSLAQISEHAKKNPDEFRLHLYTHVVGKCVETVQKHAEDLQPDTTLLKKAIGAIAKLFGFEASDEFATTIENIRRTAEHLKFTLQFDLTNETFKSAEKSQISGSDSLKAVTKFPLSMMGAEAASSISQALETSTEGTVTYLGTRLAHHNASQFLLEFLKQLQVALDLDYSLLLLDECSEANFASQVEIFRLFKTIRGADTLLTKSNTCAFFVGSVYPLGETYYPSRDTDGFAFQPGQDCTMEFMQWDETDLDAYVRFFEDMTLARAKYLLNYAGDFSSLLDDIFEDRNTFLLAAFTANGIPRRYWELLKQGYDRASRMVTKTGLDIAIQEIANNHIISQLYLKEEDMNFINKLIPIINGINIDIRRHNNKLGDKNHLPQTIYFSIKRSLVDSLAKLVVQGAIHKKARVRTALKRSRPEPIFSIDMAVAYTYRLIPPQSFVQILTKDIPLCASGDFNRSPNIKTMSGSSDISTLKDVTWDNKTQEKIKPHMQLLDGKQKGKISSYFYEKHYGFINIEALHEPVFLHSSNIDKEYLKNINPGDVVEFDIENTERGWNARNVHVIEHAQCLTGRIKSYEKGRFGFIEVSDGGPDASFEFQSIRYELSNAISEGLKVCFFVNNTPKGRIAVKIKMYNEEEESLLSSMNIEKSIP